MHAQRKESIQQGVDVLKVGFKRERGGKRIL